MSTPTIAAESNGAKKHLYPSKYGIQLSENSVGKDNIWSDTSFVDMKFEIDANKQWGNDGNE